MVGNMKMAAKSIIRLLIPYMIILIVPVAALLVSWSFITRGRIQAIIDEENSAIAAGVQRLDDKIQTITGLSELVSDNDNVSAYRINAKLGRGNDLFDCREVLNLLSSVSHNENIAQIFIFDAADGRIISSNTILSDPSLYFEYDYVAADSDPQTRLQALMESTWGHSYQNVGTVLINNKPVNVIEYQRAIPVHRHGELQLVICLDADSLFQDFLDIVGDGVEFAIYTSEGLLYGSENVRPYMEDAELSGTLCRTENGEDVYAAEFKLDNAAWTVQVFYSVGFLSDESWSMVKYLLWTVILPTFLCIGLCIGFTYGNYRRIVELLFLLRGEDVSRGDGGAEHPYVDYRLVRSYARQMAENNMAYRDQLRDVQKSSALDRLLRNSYHGEEEKGEALSRLKLSLTEGGRYVVLCIRMNEIAGEVNVIDMAGIRDGITDLLLNHIGTQMECIDQYRQELVYILGLEEEEDVNLLADNVISLLTVQMNYRYDLNLKIGMGNPVDALSQINLSYDQAREVIRYSESTGNLVRVYWQMEDLDEIFFYPVQTDDKIINYMMAGQAGDARAVIQDIYTENFKNNTRTLSSGAVDKVRRRITNTILSVADKQGIPISDYREKIVQEKNVLNYFTQIQETVDMITEQISARKNDSNSILASKVHEYAVKNYQDCDLTIKHIANHFHFHENYLSKVYKESYGENLSVAIERFRIEKAASLLRETDIKVSEVAAAVGYSSDSTFRRAFKKMTGVSPANYRNSHTEV